MWSTAKIEEADTAKTARTRLFTVLGLDQPEPRDDAYAAAAVPPSAPEPISDEGTACDSPVSIRPARSGAQNGLLIAGERQSGAGTFTEAPAAKSEKSSEKRDRQLEEKSAGIGNNGSSPVDTTVGRLSRLEASVAESQQGELYTHDSLTNLARKMTDAVHGQINVLEESLGRIAEQIGSRIQTEFEPVAKRVEGYRVQADEINSTLEVALARFTQRAEEAAKKQTWLFEDKIARTSQQAATQVQESIQGAITQLRDAAAQSLEQRVTAIAESAERRLKESFEEWSKVQLETIQQQATSLSALILTQLRTESESIAEGLQGHLKSDAQLLETKTLEAMQGRLQKVTEEFRLVLERTLT
jgi:hypothetical protein